MPLPQDPNALDGASETAFDAGPGQGGAMQIAVPLWRAAELQALSIRRLTVALHIASKSADDAAAKSAVTNDTIKRLTKVILAFTIVAAVATVIQACRRPIHALVVTRPWSRVVAASCSSLFEDAAWANGAGPADRAPQLRRNAE